MLLLWRTDLVGFAATCCWPASAASGDSRGFPAPMWLWSKNPLRRGENRPESWQRTKEQELGDCHMESLVRKSPTLLSDTEVSP